VRRRKARVLEVTSTVSITTVVTSVAATIFTSRMVLESVHLKASHNKEVS
jgi:hypothetical protein